EQFRRMVLEAGVEIGSLESEIATLDARIAEAEGEAARRCEGLSLARSCWEKENASLAAAREEHRLAQEEVERAKSDLIVRVSQHSDARSGAEALSQRIAEGERSMARLSDQTSEAVAAVEKSSRDLDAASAAETAAREALEVAERSWEDTGTALAAANATLDESVEAARSAESELRSAESRRAILSGLRERMDWASSGVRAVLQHFRGVESSDMDDRGIFGVMGEMIETDAAYEKAVEAILGERMQSVVVRDHAEGLSAIHYLKESREGRGAFIPVGLRTRNEELAYLGEEGVVAPLTEIVSAPPECRELLRGLLGGTLLVRTLDTALRLWNRNGVWNSYVTLDGDVVTADGILIGGEQGTGEAGVLARKREIRGLEKEIEGLRLELSRRSRAEEEIRRERASLEERLATFFRGREEARSAHAAAERARAVLSETRAQAGALLDGRAREEVYLRGELARMTEEFSASLATARVSEHARGEEETRTRTLLSETEAKRVRAEVVRERAHIAEVAFRGLEEKDRAAADLRAELSEQADGKRRRLIERHRRKADQEREAASLEEAMQAAREAIGQGGI
ncbi:MAG TPA: hypothetical protein VII77_08635, partial [Candidatus Deferrimicrobium sp.]